MPVNRVGFQKWDRVKLLYYPESYPAISLRNHIESYPKRLPLMPGSWFSTREFNFDLGCLRQPTHSETARLANAKKDKSIHQSLDVRDRRNSHPVPLRRIMGQRKGDHHPDVPCVYAVNFFLLWADKTGVLGWIALHWMGWDWNRLCGLWIFYLPQTGRVAKQQLVWPLSDVSNGPRFLEVGVVVRCQSSSLCNYKGMKKVTQYDPAFGRLIVFKQSIL
ncbi:hypothetical protein B0H13DRAFT_1898217 [Mycena leptocephala]|nr:hypothetical protein B0H13DRAFT_1898217 [Mycena leptocephala]